MDGQTPLTLDDLCQQWTADTSAAGHSVGSSGEDPSAIKADLESFLLLDIGQGTEDAAENNDPLPFESGLRITVSESDRHEQDRYVLKHQADAPIEASRATVAPSVSPTPSLPDTPPPLPSPQEVAGVTSPRSAGPGQHGEEEDSADDVEDSHSAYTSDDDESSASVDSFMAELSVVAADSSVDVLGMPLKKVTARVSDPKVSVNPPPKADQQEMPSQSAEPRLSVVVVDEPQRIEMTVAPDGKSAADDGQLALVFAQIDRKNNGVITVDELQEFFLAHKSDDSAEQRAAHKERITRFFLDADRNKSGSLSFEEFVDVMKEIQSSDNAVGPEVEAPRSPQSLHDQDSRGNNSFSHSIDTPMSSRAGVAMPFPDDADLDRSGHVEVWNTNDGYEENSNAEDASDRTGNKVSDVADHASSDSETDGGDQVRALSSMRSTSTVYSSEPDSRGHARTIKRSYSMSALMNPTSQRIHSMPLVPLLDIKEASIESCADMLSSLRKAWVERNLSTNGSWTSIAGVASPHTNAGASGLAHLDLQSPSEKTQTPLSGHRRFEFMQMAFEKMEREWQARLAQSVDIGDRMAQEAQDTKRTLTARLKDLERSAELSSAELTRVKAHFKLKRRECESVTFQLEEATAEVTALQTQLSHIVSTMALEKHKAVEDRDEEISSLKRMVEQLKREARQDQATIQRLTRRDEEATEARVALQDARTLVVEAEERATRTDAALQRAQAMAEAAEAARTEADQRAAAALRSVHTLKVEMSELEADRDYAQEQLDECKRLLSFSQDRVHDMSSELRQYRPAAHSGTGGPHTPTVGRSSSSVSLADELKDYRSDSDSGSSHASRHEKAPSPELTPKSSALRKGAKVRAAERERQQSQGASKNKEFFMVTLMAVKTRFEDRIRRKRLGVRVPQLLASQLYSEAMATEVPFHLYGLWLERKLDPTGAISGKPVAQRGVQRSQSMQITSSFAHSKRPQGSLASSPTSAVTPSGVGPSPSSNVSASGRVASSAAMLLLELPAKSTSASSSPSVNSTPRLPPSPHTAPDGDTRGPAKSEIFADRNRLSPAVSSRAVPTTPGAPRVSPKTPGGRPKGDGRALSGNLPSIPDLLAAAALKKARTPPVPVGAALNATRGRNAVVSGGAKPKGVPADPDSHADGAG